MNKKLLIVSFVASVILMAVFLPASKENISSVEEPTLGANLPDRCVLFSQVSSRSLKDTVKTASGKVFLVRATNAGATPMFFQLFNRTTVPVGASTPVVSEPIGGTTASRTPAVYEQRFDPPLDFTTGIAFAFSDAFGSYSSLGAGDITLDRGNLTADICYY